MFLFGGNEPWAPADWTDSDDRVRGGNSRSFFECNAFEPNARFHGELDIKTLGGAGFASQRTTGENRSWDLSDYDGIQLEITKSDSKRYTLILKDELLPKSPDNGREQATISYEYDFTLESKSSGCHDTKTVFIPFEAMKPTYRGREKKDAAPLNLTSVKRLSVMMRSFFGDQEGAFSLSIKSISAVKNQSSRIYPSRYSDAVDLEAKNPGDYESKDTTLPRHQTASRPWKPVFLLVVGGGLLYAIFRAYPLVFSRL